MESPHPVLSIVVTIVDGGSYLREFLKSVDRLETPPPMEVIVPYDDSIADILEFAGEFPDVTFVELGQITPIYPITSEAGQHELYDRRRAAGLAAATGEIIALLEDRGHPRPDWARTVVRLHKETKYNIIGGAINCQEPTQVLNWAFYVSDFGRYGLPFETGPVDWVSDVNVSYSRDVLEMTRHLWKERYNEPIVHWFLIDHGEELLLSNEVVVEHTRPPTKLLPLLSERFQWGRLFGYIRTKRLSPTKRLLFIAASPLIPPRLWLRHLMMQRKKGRLASYLVALPSVIVLTTAWTCGEVWGYITKSP